MKVGGAYLFLKLHLKSDKACTQSDWRKVFSFVVPECKKMASYSAVSEDQFLCAICLDVFVDPATIPCGHSFCKSCLEGYRSNSIYPTVCALCKTSFPPSLTIKVNITLKYLVESFKGTSAGAPVKRPTAASGEVCCDVCERGQMGKAIKTCLVCLSAYCQEHLSVHNARFSRHQLVKPLANLEERMCPIHERLLDHYCRAHEEMLCVACDAHSEAGHEVVKMQLEFMSRKAQLTKTQILVKERLKAAQEKAQKFNSSVQHWKDEAEGLIQSCNARYVALVRHWVQTCDKFNTDAEKRTYEMESRVSHQRRAHEESITALTNAAAQLEHVIGSSDFFELLKRFPSLSSAPPYEDIDPGAVIPKDLVEDLQNAFSEDFNNLPNIGNFALNGIAAPEFGKVKEFTVDVTPDPSTAHPSLHFRKAFHEIRCDRTKMWHRFPRCSERFTAVPCVLSVQGFTSQKAYWEVETLACNRNGLSTWCVGVATQSSMMTAQWNMLNPENGFWVLEHHRGQFWANMFPSTSTPVAIGSERDMVNVGIFFDGRQHRLSFYNVNRGEHLYTYERVATDERLYPVFSPDLFSPRLDQVNVMTVRSFPTRKRLC
ncbi:hypothetical protein UPYG_G00236680 [Umbra pygmaea]|uniref:Uncharacterized protein n=1 Tax=Umbra pygmaea TaxID=75934 RepID=A0ABD0WG21_UMBPY